MSLIAKPKYTKVKVTNEYDEREENPVIDPRRAVFYKTVDLFSSITGRKLTLKDVSGNKDARSGTDGFIVAAPLEHPNAYQAIERQLAHVLFRTDPPARDLFLEKYVSAIADEAGPHKVNSQALMRMMRAVVNVLDCHRVVSLWEDLYPGSAEIIRSLMEQASKATAAHAHETAVGLLAALSARGSAVEAGKQDRFRDAMELALKRVEKRSYAVVLVTARWLLTKMVDTLLEAARSGHDMATHPKAGEGPKATQDKTASVNERADALNELLETAGDVPPQIEKHYDTVTAAVGRERGADKESATTAKQALSANPNNDLFMQGGAEAMRCVVDRAMKAIASQATGDDRLCRETEAKVVFYDFTPEQIATGAAPPPLSAEDEDTIRRLRAIFIRVLGQRRRMLEDSGSEIDTVAAMERRLTRQAIPCFKHLERGQGFHAMLLLDKSQSMEDSDEVKNGPTRLHRAYRACRILSRALDFPFVKTTIWGYTSIADGQVDVVRYSPRTEIFESPSTAFTGVSPLHAGIRLGATHLEGGSEVRHLFVLTDGRPTFARRDGRTYPPKGLMKLSAHEVSDARRKGIAVTGVMLGDEMEDADLTSIFGPQRHWRRLGLTTFSRDLVKLISDAFIGYLQSR